MRTMAFIGARVRILRQRRTEWAMFYTAGPDNGHSPMRSSCLDASTSSPRQAERLPLHGFASCLRCWITFLDLRQCWPISRRALRVTDAILPVAAGMLRVSPAINLPLPADRLLLATAALSLADRDRRSVMTQLPMKAGLLPLVILAAGCTTAGTGSARRLRAQTRSISPGRVRMASRER